MDRKEYQFPRISQADCVLSKQLCIRILAGRGTPFKIQRCRPPPYPHPPLSQMGPPANTCTVFRSNDLKIRGSMSKDASLKVQQLWIGNQCQQLDNYGATTNEGFGTHVSLTPYDPHRSRSTRDRAPAMVRTYYVHQRRLGAGAFF